ncbi:DUF2892 domain-containing protein [Aerophototrophica crusticola]|uniref:DUF2892 domain-containing protein n=1 Tax=Aerophototrophica crusticola TaxID=1709002 RepID=A0A858R6I7_9PROT|nr:DUF2892 domain-containing protein [Rhodospirillaceae bacterium B3]
MRLSSDQLSSFLPIGPVNVSPAERILTGGLGGALLALGMDRGRGGGTALATLGGLLLVRAVSGHCPAYQAMGGGLRRGRIDRQRAVWREAPRDPALAEVFAGPRPDSMANRGQLPEDHQEDLVEEAVEGTFPASDPPTFTPSHAG